jgi:hypothetical protein
MTQLDQFIAQVKVGGIARTNRYSVILTPPASLPSIGGNGNMQFMLLFCDQVQVPGLNISTVQNRTFGEFREVPYEKLYGDLQLSFYVDNGMTVKRLFDDWMNLIQNPNTRTFNYYKNYITDMTINIEDVEDRKRYEVKMYECYPKTISPIQMDYAAKDVMKLQVTMQYKYWRSSPVQVAQSNFNSQPQPVANPSTDGWDYTVPESYYNDFSNFQTQYNENGYDALIDRIIRSA